MSETVTIRRKVSPLKRFLLWSQYLKYRKYGVKSTVSKYGEITLELPVFKIGKTFAIKKIDKSSIPITIKPRG